MVILSENPVNNFRDLDIYPTIEEIRGKQNYFRGNVIDGGYSSVEEYLDVQFRLLREDFVANVREAIENYQTKGTANRITVYSDLRISKGRFRKNEEHLKIEVDEGRDDPKRFMSGSLLIFTKNNFADMFLAKVAQKNGDAVFIELIGHELNSIDLFQDYKMAECSQYFDPYFQVLAALRNFSTEDFPMEKYIVRVETSAQYMPKYLLDFTFKYGIDGLSVFPWEIPKISRNLLGLNDAQFQAFKASLTQEFVVIQGPPGTGKTHLGVTIASTLVNNSHFWYRDTPMLVISHKNDALDKFLEGLIPITDRLVRVGGQSKSEKLREYNLTNDRGRTDGKKRPKGDYLRAMQQALVIGMTTSIAARWKNYLERLKAPIVIVEEAAEVLEAHVVAALTNSCQHLILLGDHQQLQPIPADHNIGKNFFLGISLFERMVMNKVQHYQLDVQHRMRPEISDLLKVKIYPFLKDHDSVSRRPHVVGMEKDVFFIDHTHTEESVVLSKKNVFEARFLVSLARYLTLNGHESQNIVILATYAGQLKEIENLVVGEKCLERIILSTLDGFQGQECEIVLLSLVRSEELGFVGKPNRICVALSRAKSGFYMMGNMDLLSRNIVWSSVRRSLERQNAIGPNLVLRCQKHQNLTRIKSLDDFWLVQLGGCSKKCGRLLSCRHICSLLCHNENIEHKCEKGCLKTVMINENKIQSHDRQGNRRNFMSVFTSIKRAVVRFINFIIERFI